MEDRRWSLAIACFVFVLFTSSSAEFLIKQVTESQVSSVSVSSVSETEYNSSYSLSPNLGLIRGWKKASPSTKLVTIDRYSVIKDRFEPYESSVFEAYGYKWRLILYVTGKKDDGGNNFNSLYVRIEETESLPKGWEVDAYINFFVHNPKHGLYLLVTDDYVKQYNEGKKEWGIGRLVPLPTFNNPNEGFIVQDTFSFGLEMFVVRPVEQQEKVTFISNPPDNVFTWRVQRFSTLEDKFYYSNEFLVGDRYWRLGFNPKGDGKGRPHAIPIFLFAQGFKPNAVATTTWGAVNLRLRNQRGTSHKQGYSAYWYPIRPGFGFGFDSIILRRDLQSGYLVNDAIVFEAEMVMVSVTNIVPT